MLEEMRKFYGDGRVYSNEELYEHFEELYGDDDLEEQNHNLRGLQQTMKRNGELENVGHGLWRLRK